jgi:hypothetical protein
MKLKPWVRIAWIASIIILILVFLVMAADYYQVNAGTDQVITEHSTSKLVDNNCGNAIFVPTKTSGEWSSFYNNAPGCISVSNALIVNDPTVSMCHWGCDNCCNLPAYCTIYTAKKICYDRGYGCDVYSYTCKSVSLTSSESCIEQREAQNCAGGWSGVHYGICNSVGVLETVTCT